MSKQIWFSYFRNVFYQRLKTIAKQSDSIRAKRSVDKSLLLLITLWLLFVNFYNYFITYATYFHCFLVIVVFFNYFLNATNMFMLITFTFFTRNWKWPSEGRNVVDFYRYFLSSDEIQVGFFPRSITVLMTFLWDTHIILSITQSVFRIT